jgi:hypothetical protein
MMSSPLVVLGPDDGVSEDGLYELSGRYGDLIVTPIPVPAALAVLATALCLLGTTAMRRRRNPFGR